MSVHHLAAGVSSAIDNPVLRYIVLALFIIFIVSMIIYVVRKNRH